ncbi:hypothetical protein [Alteromonas sp. KUL49]|uniref:hypothetical protein n=1 Tax=Alteromonas sp. KUL49 TaxID=2480798 RepID=UPI00102F0819|nr:hypothetical protein [Alteromonas sp. KUL49]TAP40937.1 hypothetical protein EYS00_07475 [Alteromonas sp. KUL49]GEA11119.1 hypothetical protein KUL49_14940 [Alteromonas sp. KUL49]
MEDSLYLVFYSASEFIAALIGFIGVIFVAVGSYKLLNSSAVPWNKVLFISIVASVALSLVEWLVISLLLDPEDVSVLIGESIFLVLSTLPFLTASVAIFKLSHYVSNDT